MRVDPKPIDRNPYEHGKQKQRGQDVRILREECQMKT